MSNSSSKKKISKIISEEFYQSLIQATQDGFWLADSHGKIVDVNQVFADMVGYSKDELTKMDIADIEAAESPEDIIKHIQKIMQQGSDHFESVHRRKDGSTVDVDISLTFLESESLFVAFIRDVSEKKKLEGERQILQEQLAHAHKMEAIGTLAGGIAHDFNNILAAIIGYADLAQEEIPAWSHSKSYITEVLKAANRAKELVKQILTFSRKGSKSQLPIQPSSIIKEGLKLMRASLPTTVEIHEDIDPDCDSIVANPTNIHQVLVNLCTNALHAMAEEKGILTVKLKRVTISERDAGLHSGVSAGPFVELLVSDTGCGMDPGTMERIFEPYFTTKGVGKGSGMGLALVHGIVQGCGGFIKVESKPGKGSTFRVYCPAIAEEHVEVPIEKQQETILIGDERILVVDDEELLVGMYKAILENLGYKVTAYISSEKLLEEFRLSPTSFDLIISDQTMPHLSGSELAKQVLQIRPDIPIILCTGYSSMISEEKAEEIGIAKFLMKPVNRKDLAVAIREVLDKYKTQNA